jgi:serine/threonine-protein kinase
VDEEAMTILQRPPRESDEVGSLAEEESRQFFQSRLSLLFRVMFTLNLFVLLTGALTAHFETTPDSSLAPLPLGVFVLYPVVTAAIGGLWLLCRSVPRSRRLLDVLDIGGTLAICLGADAVFLATPDSNDTFISTVLHTTYVLIGRSIIVPSRGRRTLLLGVILTIINGLITAWVPAAFSPHALSGFAGAFMDFASSAKIVAISAALAALTSRVIYGLRREVQQAQRLGQYLLEERIGAGGMGVVFRARHALLRRETAVKLLHPERIGEDDLRRFEQEVRLTARLTHPNTIAIYDYGRTPEGIFYYAMEYMDGVDLDELVAYAGPLPEGRVVRILEQVCGALQEAHSAGLIHRDIKPPNILLGRRGGEGDVVKVADFGLVQDVGHAAPESQTTERSVAGTPMFLAPEAISRTALDARSDLYALGAVGYFLLTGHTLFDGKTVVEVCAQHLYSKPRPISELVSHSVSRELEALIHQCLEKEPSARPESAAALRAKLLACSDVQPWRDPDAHLWWEKHGAAMRAHRDQRRAARLGDHSQEGSAELGRTVTIDLRPWQRSDAA